MFTSYIENHEPFRSLTKNCPLLDKNKRIVYTFSVFVVYKPTVITISSIGHGGTGTLFSNLGVPAHFFQSGGTRAYFPYTGFILCFHMGV